MYAITEYINGQMRVARAANVKGTILRDFGSLITSRNMARLPGVLHCCVLHTVRNRGDIVHPAEMTIILSQSIDSH